MLQRYAGAGRSGLTRRIEERLRSSLYVRLALRRRSGRVGDRNHDHSHPRMIGINREGLEICRNRHSVGELNRASKTLSTGQLSEGRRNRTRASINPLRMRHLEQAPHAGSFYAQGAQPGYKVSVAPEHPTSSTQPHTLGLFRSGSASGAVPDP